MRLSADTRRDAIFRAALAVARNKGLQFLTWHEISSACSIPTSYATVRRYTGTQGQMQQETVNRAAASGDECYRAFLKQAADIGIRPTVPA